MTKNLGNAKIIVETAYERYEFTANSAQIGSNTGGADHFLTTSRLWNMVKTPIPAERADMPYSIGGADLPAPQCPQETAMIGAAKAQERATLEAARIIEVAQEQAEALINDADHTLDMAIQAYQHTGKSALDTDRVLDNAGLQQ